MNSYLEDKKRGRGPIWKVILTFVICISMFATVAIPTQAKVVPVIDTAALIKMAVQAVQMTIQLARMATQIKNQATQIVNQGKQIVNQGKQIKNQVTQLKNDALNLKKNFTNMTNMRTAYQNLLGTKNQIKGIPAEPEGTVNTWRQMYPSSNSYNGMSGSQYLIGSGNSLELARNTNEDAMFLTGRIINDQQKTKDQVDNLLTASENAPGAVAVGQVQNNMLATLSGQMAAQARMDWLAYRAQVVRDERENAKEQKQLAEKQSLQVNYYPQRPRRKLLTLLCPE